MIVATIDSALAGIRLQRPWLGDAASTSVFSASLPNQQQPCCRQPELVARWWFELVLNEVVGGSPASPLSNATIHDLYGLILQLMEVQGIESPLPLKPSPLFQG